MSSADGTDNVKKKRLGRVGSFPSTHPDLKDVGKDI